MSISGDRHGDAERPLLGCTVVVTRERPGELARQLTEAGAEVVHVPLIEVTDPDAADQSALELALQLGPGWVIVSSPAGAERVGDFVRTQAGTRLAAVGTATAQRLGELAGRAVDLVPQRQLGDELAVAFNRAHTAPQQVVVAHGDLAGGELVDGLRSGGHDVTAITAYRTVQRQPSSGELEALTRADAVLFASGSAASGWSAVLGAHAVERLPPIVAVIGPTTAAAAWESGLKVTDIAADHSVAGLVGAVTLAWRHRQR